MKPDAVSLLPTVAFLGTGIMGARMCTHVLRAGYPTRVWNRTRSKADALAVSGAVVCESAAEAIAAADYVICMLDTGDVIDHVLFADIAGREAAVDRLAANAVLIVMSSIPVATAKRQATRLAARGVRYVDAPVSGGEKGATEATLTIMAGGDTDVIEQARALLETMGRVTRVGPTGAGQLAKLANQTIVGITIGAVAEALTLARRGGADPAAVREALLGGFADSAILRQHGQRMIERTFTPGARAQIQLKDLRTARALAEEEGVELPLLRLAERQFQRMCERGMAELDHSALYVMLEQTDV
jgi:3-hydroxyisobutyrate dehydrogenase-like beta-hydroxyacid dehydrogenase